MDESKQRREAVLGILRGNGADGASCPEVWRRMRTRGAWFNVSRTTIRKDLGALAVDKLIRPGAHGSGWWFIVDSEDS